MNKYVNVESCFFKRKVNGNWKDDTERPAVLLKTKYAKIKFSIDEIDNIIEELERIKILNREIKI